MPNANRKNPKITNNVRYSPKKRASTVSAVAPPSHTANDVSQQQLVPKTNASTPPKNDFL